METNTTPGRLAASLAAEFAADAAVSRRVLERVPFDKADWQPHEKSMKFGQLAAHIAELQGFAVMIMREDGLDFAEREYVPFSPASSEELLKFFDEAVAASKAAILATSDEDLQKEWTLRRGETVFFTLPKIGAVRAMVSGHGIHHRGQLSVYLRLNDIPVPSIYGPSADESVG
ncbi:MAG: DinB family protein [Acidobacteria bacterium OLB17]|nr:MAG: DinB family protein [Acidobacteria bacterium OLB17]MCZ2391387.1 DinB family protein [Acidobacteriota bacterium]